MGATPLDESHEGPVSAGIVAALFPDCLQSDETVFQSRFVHLLRASRSESLYVACMTVGWRFIGEVWGLSKRPIVLECVVPIADRKEAEAIARKRLAGADSITAIELSQPDKGAAPH
jgi:hypothetical protein